ncbi:hypothetical protein ACYZTM_03190 [Pseudomonas sp. MDT2-39-1]
MPRSGHQPRRKHHPKNHAHCPGRHRRCGIAALPCFLGEHYGLQAMETVGAGLTREVWLVVHSDIRHTPSVQAVMSFLASCFEN